MMRTWARGNGHRLSGGVLAGVALDDPQQTDIELCRHELALEVPRYARPAEGIEIGVRSAGLWACISVEGDLETVHRQWAFLYRSWLPQSGYAEIYLTLPEAAGWSNYHVICCMPVKAV
jgi:DNA gyrase inhibitor GyrI